MKSLLIIFFVLFSCKDKPVQEFSLGQPMTQLFTDTNANGKEDAVAYYLDNPKDYRIVYQEHDTNEDKITDLFIWSGFATFTPPNRPEKETVKVHEAEDTNKDGKVDTLRWLLPNDHIALSQVDKDGDGFFETTNYYNRKKQIVRTEVDTNKDGVPDRVYWLYRVEVDTDHDGYPDHFGESESETELRRMTKEQGLKPLPREKSWVLNPSLVPKIYSAIIQFEY